MNKEQLLSFKDLYVRDAILCDQSGVVLLVSQTMQEFGLPVYSTSVEKDFETALKLGRSNGAGFWVAEHQQIIVGSIAILPYSKEICSLRRFYILREYRGHGLGKKLYELAENFAREAKYRAITLEASRKFKKAIAFYTVLGYNLSQEIDNEWEDNIYRKSLCNSIDNLLNKV